MSNPEVLVMAAGFGKRLESVTGMSVPKAAVPVRHDLRGIDIFLNQLAIANVEATFSSREYYDWYKNEILKTSHRMLWQRPGGVIEAILQRSHPTLILAPDFIFDMSWLHDMMSKHVPGTISWAVSPYSVGLMDNYRGCSIVDEAIVGRADNTYTRSFAMIIEPDIIRPFVTENKNEKAEGENLFYEVLPRLEAYNLERIREGKCSILNSYRIPGRVFDYGTPDRLNYLSQNLEEVLKPESRTNKKSEQFYVYDTEMNPVDVRSRERVHVDGGWHRGVQLNIICEDKILLQRRSDSVDIAKSKYDQALATQLLTEDDHDEMKALRRGLEQELGIAGRLHLEKVTGPRRIVKRYKYDKTLLNREYVSLYEARVSKIFVPKVVSPKTNEFLWVPIDRVKELAMSSPDKFTKTFLMWLKEVM